MRIVSRRAGAGDRLRQIHHQRDDAVQPEDCAPPADRCAGRSRASARRHGRTNMRGAAGAWSKASTASTTMRSRAAISAGGRNGTSRRSSRACARPATSGAARQGDRREGLPCRAIEGAPYPVTERTVERIRGMERLDRPAATQRCCGLQRRLAAPGRGRVRPRWRASGGRQVEVDARWRNQAGNRERAPRGRSDLSMRSVATIAEWTLDGAVIRALDHLVDLDYGFTPATTCCSCRARAEGPREGRSPGRLVRSGQRVADGTAAELRSGAKTSYRYEAPTVPYQALLAVAPSGFVRSYPGLSGGSCG